MVEFAHLTGDRQNVSGLPMHAPLLSLESLDVVPSSLRKAGLARVCRPCQCNLPRSSDVLNVAVLNMQMGIDLDCGACYVYTMNVHANSEQINNSSLKCLHKKTNMASLGNSCLF